MSRMITALIVVVLAGSASAAGPASLVQGYNGISVQVSRDAAQCGLQRSDAYNAHLAERLFEQNVPLDGLLPVSANLTLSAAPFSQIGGKCVVVATLAFTIPMEATEIEVAEVVTNREEIVAVFEQMDTVPVVLYERSEFTVADANAGHQTALSLIDDLARRFGAAR